MHLVETMAYAGETPWHGLGNKLAPQQSIDTWKKQAGMDWQIEQSEVRYISGNNHLGVINAFPAQKVLYRSDTKAPLAVVSKRFHVVQPGEILEFYRDLTAYNGFELETAGVLREGRKFWALAKTGQSTSLKGRDRVDGYLLLRQLGITVSSWDGFVTRMKSLVARPVDPDTVEGLLRRVLTYAAPDGKAVVVNEQALATVRSLYEGGGRGALMASSRGTAWGVLNSVTEYVDHHRRARSVDHRLDAAWFGQGAQIKQRAWDEALKLLA
jgi:hypothetical protein